jgi:hypothetical protein
LTASLKVDTFYPCLLPESMQVDKKYPSAMALGVFLF